MSAHVFAFMTKLSSMTSDEFHSYWLHNHRRSSRPAGDEPTPPPPSPFAGYIQNHGDVTELGAASSARIFDGYAEFWLEDANAWLEFTRTPRYATGRADEENFQPCRPEHVVTADRVLRAPERGDEVHKVVLLFRRRQGTRLVDFRDGWAGAHADRVMARDDVRGYLQCEAVDQAYELCEPRYDGVEELWVRGDVGPAVDETVASLTEIAATPVTALAVVEHVILEPTLA
jgi:hypothetical protein